MFQSIKPETASDSFWEKYNVIKLFFDHPLYLNFDLKSKELLITIFSDTRLSHQAQYFISYALQFCQSRSRNIKISVVTPEPEITESLYLADKPLISEFIQIGDSVPNDHYGVIEFLKLDLKDSLLINITEKSNYFFISVENEAKALNIEDFILEHSRDPEIYIASEYEGIGNVWINAQRDFDNRLEQYAFNLHLSWANQKNVRFHEEYQNYLSEYNHLSSISGSVGLFYILNEFDLLEENLNETARKLQGLPENLISEMAHLEHRRWVIEKVLDGWDRLSQEEYVQIPQWGNAYIEDENRRAHACLVKSKPEFKLQTFEQAHWDELEPSSLDLDDLDRLSINIHRVFKELAEETLYQREDIDRIYRDIKSRIKSKRKDIRELLTQLDYYYELIFTKDRYAGDYFSSLSSDLIEKIENKTLHETLSALFQDLNQILFPIKRYLNPIDYKFNNRQIIENIPYILSNKLEKRLGLCFEISDNATDNFKNLISATLLNPTDIFYFIYLENKKQLEAFIPLYKQALNYLEKRSVNSNIHLNAYVKSVLEPDLVEYLTAELEKISKENSRITFNLQVVDSEKEVEDLFLNTFYDHEITFFDAQTDLPNRQLDFLLTKLIEDDGFPSFSYSAEEGSFDYIKNCDFLYYLDMDDFFLHLSEIFPLNQARILNYHVPSLEKEVGLLWKISTGLKKGEPVKDRKDYAEHIHYWNELCNALDTYHSDRESDKLYTFSFTTPGLMKNPRLRSFEIDVPSDMDLSFNYLVSVLKENEIIGSSPEKERITENFITYRIETEYPNLEDGLRTLLEQEKFRYRDRLHIYAYDSFYGSRLKIQVRYNNLRVFNFNCSPTVEWKKNKRAQILKELAEINFIQNLSFDESGFASFEYPSNEHKEILTSAGKLLELYCYYALKNSGLFNEIATSVEIKNDLSGETNEFDLVAIKNFRAFIIECKQTEKLKQEYIHKLRSLSLDYDINATGIIIANNYSVGRKAEHENNINRLRAIRNGVGVINQPEDIINLKETIKEYIH